MTKVLLSTQAEPSFHVSVCGCWVFNNQTSSLKQFLGIIIIRIISSQHRYQLGFRSITFSTNAGNHAAQYGIVRRFVNLSPRPKSTVPPGSTPSPPLPQFIIYLQTIRRESNTDISVIITIIMCSKTTSQFPGLFQFPRKYQFA